MDMVAAFQMDRKFHPHLKICTDLMAAPDRESANISRDSVGGTPEQKSYFAQVKLAAEFGSQLPLYFADWG